MSSSRSSLSKAPKVAALHKEGIPSLAFIAGPNHLIALDGRHGHFDKLNPTRMRHETLWAADTLHRLDPLPAPHLHSTC